MCRSFPFTISPSSSCFRGLVILQKRSIKINCCYPAKEIDQERLFDLESFDLESLPYPGRTAGTEDENRVNWKMKDKSLLGED